MPKKTVEQLIEELALSVGRGFEEVQSQMRTGFAVVSERLDRMEFEASGQDRRFSTLEDKIRVLSNKAGLDVSR